MAEAQTVDAIASEVAGESLLPSANGVRQRGGIGSMLDAARRHQRALVSAFETVPALGTRRATVLHRLLALADGASGAFAATVTVLVFAMSAEHALPLIGAFALGWPLLAFVFGLYAVADLRSWATGVPEAKTMVVAVLAMSWLTYGLATLLGAAHAPQVALVGATVLMLSAAVARAVARGAAHRSKTLRQRVVIVGSGVVAKQLVDRLRRHTEFGLTPVGIVDDDAHMAEACDVPWLGRLDDLKGVLDDHSIDRVVIAFSRASHEELLTSIRACRDNGLPVHVVPRLFEFLDGARALDHVGGLPLLSLGVPQLTRSSRGAKRALDVGLSLSALVVLAPVMIAIALAIRLESRGPVIFRQPRNGRDQDVFSLLKFRSMHVDAEHHKSELADRNDLNDGVMFKMHRDPRITRVGRFLRRLSLDELPQLINVVRGEMSLVGPRPLVLDESTGLGDDWQARRQDLRPGLTGPWQIYGRSDLPFDDMVRFDYQYVTGWSLVRDVEILFATVPAVLSGRGAY
jgi:exopolysaccharide biosynthesis polyprenyl glycosylphosphotransferase